MFKRQGVRLAKPADFSVWESSGFCKCIQYAKQQITADETKQGWMRFEMRSGLKSFKSESRVNGFSFRLFGGLPRLTSSDVPLKQFIWSCLKPNDNVLARAR